jgi:hypothetical protein
MLITVHPSGCAAGAEITGFNLANGNTRSKENGAQVTSVAGARIHLYQTFVTS